MTMMTLNEYTIELKNSKIEEVEQINLQLDKLAEFKYIEVNELNNKEFVHASIVCEYELDELLEIYQDAM